MYKLFIKEYKPVKTKNNSLNIIIIAGVLASTNYWEEFAQLLCSIGYNVFVIDSLGFGKSPKPFNTAYSIEDQIQSINNTLKINNIYGKCILIGHSSGALIAAAFCMKYPQGIIKLIMVSPPLFTDENKARETLIKNSLNYKYFIRGPLKPLFIASKFILKPILISTAPYTIRHIPKKARKDVYKHTWRSLSKSLENVVVKHPNYLDFTKIKKIPVNILYNKHDKLISLGYYYSLANEFPNISVTHVDISNGKKLAKHQLPLEAPNFIIKQIEKR